MSIAAAVEAATKPKYCKFGRILVDLAGPDFQAITDGLENGLTYIDAARILTAEGFPVSDKSVGVHVAGECSCQAAT